MTYPSKESTTNGRDEGGRPRVMICDDNTFSVEQLAINLKAHGIDVEITERPQDCLAQARRKRYDIFVLDMSLGSQMPADLPDGLALARAIWKQTSPVTIPIVGITAFVSETWRERALDLGLVNFFNKPFQLSVVVPELLKLLQTRSRARQAMEGWLAQAVDRHWHVVELTADPVGGVKIQSTLVSGSGRLSRNPGVDLGERLLATERMDGKQFEEIGSHLRESLIPSQLNVGFHQHRLLSKLAQKPFRLLLRVAGSGLEHLPWEYCRYTYGTDNGHWLGGDPHLTCARLAPKSGRLVDDEVLQLPLRILVVGASPAGMARLNLKGELEAMAEALEPLSPHVKWRRLGPRELKPRGDASPETVNEEIRDFKPHIVHFMCHGRSDGLVVERDGELAVWSDYFLGLDLSGRDVKLLVFNSCLSAHPGERSPGVALSSVSSGVGAVAGHLFPVSDRAALRFSRLLYEGLARQDALDVAFQEARQLVWTEELTKDRPFLPVLYVRDRFLKIDPGNAASS